MPRRSSSPSLPSGVRRLSQLRRQDTLSSHRRSVLAAFIGLGFHVGVWAVLLADLIAALGISTRTTGIALSALAAGGIVTLVAGGQIADRIGHRAVLITGMSGIGCFFLLLARVDSVASLVIVSIAGGAAAGFYDLAVNSLGGDFQRRYRQQAMTTFHAGFSLGAAAGAFAAGLALSGGLEYQTIFTIAGVVLLMLSIAALVAPLAAPAAILPTDHDDASPARVRWLPAGVILAAILVSLAFLTDASLEGYVSYYLRTLLGSGPLLGASAIAVFHLAVALGRLGSQVVLRRTGERRLLVASGLLGASGLLTAIATSSPPIASGGLLLVGFALSPVAPVAYSLATRSSPGREARAISMVTVAAYTVFLAGPVAVGALAAVTSLRTAWILPICGLGALAFVSWRAPVGSLTDAQTSPQPHAIERSFATTVEE